MAKKPLPTPDELRQLLRYEPETGHLVWRARGPEWFKEGSPTKAIKTWNIQHAGAPALRYVSPTNGYLYGNVLNCVVVAHRVCWAIHTGQWPRNYIDHINGNRTDNRIVNLRDVTQSQNMMNARRSRANRSGITGVFWCNRRHKWGARVMVDGKNINLGVFDRIEDAAAARAEANRVYGFHADHGKRPPLAVTK